MLFSSSNKIIFTFEYLRLYFLNLEDYSIRCIFEFIHRFPRRKFNIYLPLHFKVNIKTGRSIYIERDCFENFTRTWAYIFFFERNMLAIGFSIDLTNEKPSSAKNRFFLCQKGFFDSKCSVIWGKTYSKTMHSYCGCVNFIIFLYFAQHSSFRKWLVLNLKLGNMVNIFEVNSFFYEGENATIWKKAWYKMFMLLILTFKTGGVSCQNNSQFPCE